MNFLEETGCKLEDSDYSPEDIAFIGSEISGHSCTWSEFTVLANAEYDEGFGAPKVAEDLVIVFKDGAQLKREEYDGSEWWELHKPFNQPAHTKPIQSLFARGVGWASLSDINKR